MKTTLAIIATLLLGTCSQPPTILEDILRGGELRVVTRNLPSAYYLGARGPQGPEYDLASRFADELGVNLYIYSAPTVADVIRELESGRAHIAAAGLTRGLRLPPDASFGPPYQQVKEHLIFRQRDVRPRNIEQAARGHIEIVAGSSHSATLEQLRTAHPNLSWVENPSAETEELLYRLSRREFDYTVADSNEFAIGRAFHPEIRVAFDLSGGKALAWAVNASDASLLKRVTAFFAALKAEGRLASILSTYYDETDRFDYISARVFIDHVETRLPLYRQWFKDAAAEVGVDWRLLAAVGYQESHWDPNATSPTGVRGLMMLTEDTARSLNVENRLDPQAAILGGARYFVWIRNQIPQRILEPDRTWLTLAAYNVGVGHVEDARILTQMHGKNPDSWNDVREHLPLLTQAKWYTRVKRGYARGWEPVRFVENIRGYMDILDWVATDSGPAAQRELTARESG
ncbi:MAG: membrane-bound lytic murein transglycosylase MltF [Steroidobacteraceae bacterium]|nr:membrane-bound lytic murein transglycosylase MltF [Steroidobacteraceae bacterium]